jgi:beta-lactamase regulating signal transducer with metallopeptidase domain
MALDSARLLAFLLNAAVQVTLLAAGAALALRVARPASARLKSGLAIAGLVLCAVVPILSAWPAPVASGVAIVRTPPVDTSALAGTRLTGLLLAGYLAATVWKVVTLARALRVTIDLRRSSTPIVDGPIAASFADCGAGRRGIELRQSSRATSPLVCGVVRPAIVFPDRFAASDRALIDAVIAHECAHVERRDVAVTIAIEALTAPIAWHPAVAALKRAAARYRESACDEAAVARLGWRRTAYATLLLSLAEGRTNRPAALVSTAAAHLEARVRSLLAPGRAGRARVAAPAIAGLCLTATAVAAPLVAIAVDPGWTPLSGVWTLDLDRSQPRGQLPFRAIRLRIDAARDQVAIVQQRTRSDGVDEAFEIRRRTDDVPAPFTFPDGMIVQTRARWEGSRFVANSTSVGSDWHERVEAVAVGSQLVIRTESVSAGTARRFAFVFRKQ